MNLHLLDAWSHDLIFAWISALPRQAAPILLVALLIRAFPRTSAAWRHWMWWVVAIAIGVLPVAAVMLPRLPWIPAEWVFGEDAGLVMDQVINGQSSANFSPAVTAVAEPVKQSISLATVILCAWMLGTAWLLFRVLAGFLGLRSFQRGRKSVVVGRLCARMEKCRRKAGVTTVVDLYLSPRSHLPMTWGVLTPAINLPQEAIHWGDDRLDAVFMHEFGHIRRADCWSNLILRLVCAVNWFNPFIWMAARRAYLAQEQACDDFACEEVRASDYARHLLHLAATIQDKPSSHLSSVAVGFLSGNHLRVRLNAALDPLRYRDSLSNRVASFMSFAIMSVTVVAAMVSLHVEDVHATVFREARTNKPKPLVSVVKFDEGLKEAQNRAEIAGWQIKKAMQRAVKRRELSFGSVGGTQYTGSQGGKTKVVSGVRNTPRVAVNSGPVNVVLPSSLDDSAAAYPSVLPPKGTKHDWDSRQR